MEAGESEEPTLRKVLDDSYDGLADIEHPVARARLMTVMGRVYGSLDQSQRSRELLRSAIETLRAAPGDNAEALSEALMELAYALPPDEADAPASEALRIRREQLGDQHTLTAAAWNRRGEMRYYAKNFEAALADFKVALEIWEAIGESARLDIANVIGSCGASCTELVECRADARRGALV